MQTSQVFKSRIALALPAREQMIALLNQQLADTVDLYSQTKQAHWNVKGAQFFQVHLLFDKLAGEQEAAADLIAERATTLGGTARGTTRMAAAASRLVEFAVVAGDSMASVEALASRYASLAVSTWTAVATAAAAGDAGTADLLTSLGRGLDASLWFLEAHLQA